MKWLTLGVALATLPVAAQLSSSAPVTVPTVPAVAPVRWPDVAYEPHSDVFLAISGASVIQGQYFTPDGQRWDDPFVVNADTMTYAQCPRVAAGPPQTFLVTWHSSTTSGPTVRARLLRRGAAPLTGEIDLSTTVSNHEMGAASAFATGSQQFLVVWQVVPGALRALRLSAVGVPVGTEFAIDPTAPYVRDPSVGYAPGRDHFLVAYAGCVGNDDCFVRAQRVDAATGALIGAPVTLDAAAKATYVPEVAWASGGGHWLVVWYRSSGTAAAMHARAIFADGSLGPARVASAMNGSYDANSVAFNPVSNTFVMVTHGPTEQDYAVELNAEGAPLDAAGTLFGVAATNGNFNPRIAAATRSSDFLAVTSTAFGALTVQRLSSATRLGPDGGEHIDGGPPDAGGADSGVPDDAGFGGGADAGSRPDAGGPDIGGGSAGGTCGCSQSSASLWVPGLVLAAGLRRRRNRCPTGPKTRCAG